MRFNWLGENLVNSQYCPKHLILVNFAESSNILWHFFYHWFSWSPGSSVRWDSLLIQLILMDVIIDKGTSKRFKLLSWCLQWIYLLHIVNRLVLGVICTNFLGDCTFDYIIFNLLLGFLIFDFFFIRFSYFLITVAFNAINFVLLMCFAQLLTFKKVCYVVPFISFFYSLEGNTFANKQPIYNTTHSSIWLKI